MEKYKYWDVYEDMPEGYKIDTTVGSPLYGYEYAIDKPPLKGGKRILVHVYKDIPRYTKEGLR